jgi:hypothetical protein
MFDEKLLNLFMEKGVSVFALFLGYKIFCLVLAMWKSQQESQNRAHEHQHREHEEQTELLNRAHVKLDTIAKVVHR